eukprot:TRINITY_DN639_c0_g1_i4.p1 TRINITY_DN639_c0_g1~~TRINITY_DN639_c0_g1_i4.p1  ORF type:complete len:233 (+),score=45.92 TRINITY_DN639_c0_g1_i4:396-1094(+)
MSFHSPTTWPRPAVCQQQTESLPHLHFPSILRRASAPAAAAFPSRCGHYALSTDASVSRDSQVADTDTQFDDLRRAQKRSDLRVKVGLTGAQVEEIPSEVTLDLTLAILDFILSENGRFLREPLIDELLDTVDSIGGLAVEYASANSRGLISAPQSAPDRERLATLWNIVVQVRYVHSCAPLLFLGASAGQCSLVLRANDRGGDRALRGQRSALISALLSTGCSIAQQWFHP